jgi:hypothetical protein
LWLFAGFVGVVRPLGAYGAFFLEEGFDFVGEAFVGWGLWGQSVLLCAGSWMLDARCEGRDSQGFVP